MKLLKPMSHCSTLSGFSSLPSLLICRGALRASLSSCNELQGKASTEKRTAWTARALLYCEPQDALCKQAARSNLQSCSNAVRLVIQFRGCRLTFSLMNHSERQKESGGRDVSSQGSVLPALPHKVVRSPTALLFHVCG